MPIIELSGWQLSTVDFAKHIFLQILFLIYLRYVYLLSFDNQVHKYFSLIFLPLSHVNGRWFFEIWGIEKYYLKVFTFIEFCLLFLPESLSIILYNIHI